MASFTPDLIQVKFVTGSSLLIFFGGGSDEHVVEYHQGFGGHLALVPKLIAMVPPLLQNIRAQTGMDIFSWDPHFFVFLSTMSVASEHQNEAVLKLFEPTPGAH